MEIKSNIINKPKSLITINGDMGVRERKVYNTLLSLIEKEPFPTDKESGKYYYTSIADIKRITNITAWNELKDVLLNKLPDTKLRIDILNKDEEKRRVVQLIGEIEIINKNKVKLFFTPTIIQMVKNQNYTKLEMDVLSRLNSKYSLTMFEVIKRYYVSNTSFYTIPDMKLEDFRSLMGIDEKHYKRIADLKKKVLNQITKDINEKTDFQINYELYKRNSRSFNYVRFDFSKKEVEENKSEEESENRFRTSEIELLRDRNEILEYSHIRAGKLEKEVKILERRLDISESINREFKNIDVVTDDDLIEDEVVEEKEIGLPF